jgi:hypothetical protein
MRNIINMLESTWARRPGASPSELADAEQSMVHRLPSDYKLFLQWSDGGEGQVGNRYLSLWKASELSQLNADYEIATYLPGLVAIGTDGGDLAYAFDFRNPEGAAVVEVPLGDLDPASAVKIADRFEDFLRRTART